MGEGEGVGVVCSSCKGTGHRAYAYEPFYGRKQAEGVKRVFLSGYGYQIGLGRIDFSGVGFVDMDREGVSYAEFVNGKMPTHIERMCCPLLADQGACHDKKGFVTGCHERGCQIGGSIHACKHQDRKRECWDRFRADG
jgi:hypothetical protein